MILLSVVSIVVMEDASASHIVGGDAIYTFVRHNADSTMATYEVTFTVYRDENGIGYEPLATFGIYRLIDNDTWVTERVIENIPIQNIQEINATNDPCSMQTISDIKVQSGIYSFEVTLPVIDNYYKIAYQKCCRNHAINNIKDAGITGAVFDLKISAEAQLNGISSPRFASLPPTYICVNEPLHYVHSGMDSDDRELRYSFCVPYVAGGIIDYTPQCCDCQNPEVGFCPPPFEEVIYKQGYSYDNPIGGSPQVRIDPITGIISGTPNQIGAYVVGVCIEEFVDGKVISQTRRDFQFNVVECTTALTAALEADTNYISVINGVEKTINEYHLCHDESLDIINQSSELQYINEYNWILRNDKNEIYFESSGSDAKDLYIQKLEHGIYEGEMILNISEACSDTAYISVTVHDEIEPEFTYSYDPCYMSSVQFTPTIFDGEDEIIYWNWNLGDGTSLDAESGAYFYKDRGQYNVVLTIMDAQQCTYSTEMMVDYNPMTDMPALEVEETTKLICEGDYYTFDNIDRYDEGTYEYFIPTVDNQCDSIHYILNLYHYPETIEETRKEYICQGQSILFDGEEFNQTGSYYKSFKFENADCDSLMLELIVEEAILPDVKLKSDTTITIRTDYALPLSIYGDYNSITWTPDYYLDCNSCINPITNLTDNQSFTAYIKSIDGCEIRKNININVEENNDFYMPNIISKSPNNNTLFVQSRSEIKYKYDMYIYDRYGNLIHECIDAVCNDSSIGWTPQDFNPGVFVYYVQFKDEYYKGTLSGSITIIE